MPRFSRYFALFFFAASLAFGADPVLRRTRYTIEDGPGEKPFVVAPEELAQRDAKGKWGLLKLPAVPRTAEATRQNARQRERSDKRETELVLYPEGEPKTDANRRFLRRQITVKLQPGANPAVIAAAHGLVYKGEVAAARGFHVFEAAETGGALEAAETLRADGKIAWAQPQLARLQHKRFTPNDPLFTNQWHLRSTSGGAIGVNVPSVWDTYKGTGIRIGIVDDGLQVTHPDLSPNVDSVNDHDWNDSTPDDPSPDVSADFHGSSCAGVAAGKGNNGIGISGAAPEAKIVGLRLIAAAETDQDEADAIGWKNDLIQIKSNSWGPNDDGKTLEGPGTLATAALAQACTTGRGGLGTIFTWAAGNGGDVGDNSNYDGYANSIYTIAIAAFGSDGVQAYYSEPGANVVVTAPSSSTESTTLGITTTDLIGTNGYNTVTTASGGDYCNDFGGTSSACPLAAGVIALVLQANPNLGWRDVQEILIRSAAKCAPTDADWVNNAAGYHFNHKYGAGLIDAQAAVNMALAWTNLPAQQSVSSALTGLNQSIPNNNTTGITKTFAISSANFRVEQVTVNVNLTHPARGDLAITLTSPSGTVSRLAESHSDTGDNYTNWTFSSVRTWGESAAGTWTLKIADVKSSNSGGVLSSATLTVYGSQTGPVNGRPTLTQATLSPGTSAYSDQTIVTTSLVASDPEGDAITFGYQWQQSTDGTTYADISGATNGTLTPGLNLLGSLVHCVITPSDAGGAGTAYTTSAVDIRRRPTVLAQQSQAYSFDCDLFLTGGSGGGGTAARVAIINEVSQGSGTSKDWVELLTLQTTDLRGYKLRDNNGTYTTFASVAAWSAVPAGTLIVIFNGNDRDTTLPATDDTDFSDRRVILAHNNTTFFTAGTWGGLSNSGADAAVLQDASSQTVDGVSFNNDSTYTPSLGALAATKTAWFTGDSDTLAEQSGSWTIGATSISTPGAGNGGANTTWIAALRSGGTGTPLFRFGTGNETVAGLSLDSSTGVLSGTPTVAGCFNIVIERYNGTVTNSQTFTLLVADPAGATTVTAGHTFTLTGNLTLGGALTVVGSLDTAGFNLTVPTLLKVIGSVTNTSGTISYLQRSGNRPPGTVALIANAANDVADTDLDGLRNLVEFFLGSDPALAGATAAPVLSRSSGRNVLTFSTPVGITGVTFTVEVSGDLSTWTSGVAATEMLSDTTASGIRTMSVRDLTAGTGRFIRLKVSR